MEALVELTKIRPNPWQPRLSEDKEHIAKLAASIAADGLMQVPSARLVDGVYQLAFGHSRFAAYELLNVTQEYLRAGRRIEFEDGSAHALAVAEADKALDNGASFDMMPLHIVELDDEQMYRYAVSENIQRRDLTPIEMAKAMVRYREEFGKTSKEIGELFAMNESTVRGIIRLVELPENLQEKVASGEMTIGSARKVLMLKRVLPKDKAESVFEKIADADKYSDEDVNKRVETAIKTSDQMVTMWSKWHGTEPKAGVGLWPLDWTFERRMLTVGEIKKLFAPPYEKSSIYPDGGMANLLNVLETATLSITNGWRSWDQQIAEHMQRNTTWANTLTEFRQLCEPPACTACPLMMRNDGYIICADKTCFERKRQVWAELELERMVKETQFAAYDKERDGEYVVIDWGGVDFYTQHHPDVRLMVKISSNNHHATISTVVCAVLVGETARRLKQAKEDARQQAGGLNDDQARKRKQEAMSMMRGAMQSFMLEQAAPLMAVVFEKLPKGVVHELYENAPGRWMLGEDRSNEAACAMFGILYQMTQDKRAKIIDMMESKPVHYLATHIHGIAVTWGVKLPVDWLRIADRYEPDLSEFADLVKQSDVIVSVSVETE